MVPYEDPKIIITTAVEYALSSYPSGKGFILVANCKKKLIGASVCIQMDKIGIIPENMLVYLCVHKDYRRRGICSRLLQETLWKVDGDVKLHIEKNNPAIKLYKKMGFKDEYFEMRLDKGGNH
jgi:ribosomal protein S18 acetylase RimI-like enzyme